jgi:hypothetical protein
MRVVVVALVVAVVLMIVVAAAVTSANARAWRLARGRARWEARAMPIQVGGLAHVDAALALVARRGRKRRRVQIVRTETLGRFQVHELLGPDYIEAMGKAEGMAAQRNEELDAFGRFVAGLAEQGRDGGRIDGDG